MVTLSIHRQTHSQKKHCNHKHTLTTQHTSLHTFALVCGAGGQGVAVETLLAAVAEEAVRVVDALEALARLAVAVAHGVGVHVVAALARAAGPHRPLLAQRVPEEAVVTQLTALPWGGGMGRPWG